MEGPNEIDEPTEQYADELRGIDRVRGLGAVVLVVAQLRGNLTSLGHHEAFDHRLPRSAPRRRVPAFQPGDEAVKLSVHDVLALASVLEEMRRIEGLSLEDELAECAAKAVSIVFGTPQAPDRVEMVCRRYGLAGQPPETLQAIGDSVGLTRERVRQITDRKVCRATEQMSTPAFDRALRIVTEAVPCTVETVPDVLLASGVTNREYSLESIFAIAKLFGREVPVTVDTNARVVIRKEMREGAARAMRTARKRVEHLGIASVREVFEESVLEADAFSETDLRRVLEQMDGFEWLGDGSDRFFLRTVKRNRLLNQITKIMCVAGAIEVSELRDGISRHYRMVELRYPSDVILAFCSKFSFLEVEGTRVVGADGLPEWSDELSEVESVLAENLLATDSGIMRKQDLIDAAMAQGCKKNTLGVYLTYSPILKQLARGVWGLRGAQATPAEVEALVPPLEKKKVLKAWGWTSSGRVWTCHRLSAAAVDSAVLTTPADLLDVLKGKYELYERRGDSRVKVGDLVVEGQMWGLSPFFGSGRVEEGDYVRIEYELSDRTAEIRVGGSELELG